MVFVIRASTCIHVSLLSKAGPFHIFLGRIDVKIRILSQENWAFVHFRPVLNALQATCCMDCMHI
jgi:hypothetical protein